MFEIFSQYIFSARHARRSDIISFAFAALMTMGLGLSIPAEAASPGTADYKAPVDTFLTNYLKDANADHYNPSPNLNIPAVWLYSPKGQLVTLATSTSELEKLTETFPPAGTATMPDQPSLQILLGVVAQSSGVHPSASSLPTDGKWTAVLFLTDMSGCTHCAPFQQSVRDFAQKQPTRVHLVTVLLTH